MNGDAALVLKIFLAILPMLLAFMNRKQGMICASKVDFGVVRKYFIFQVSVCAKQADQACATVHEWPQWPNTPAQQNMPTRAIADLSSAPQSMYAIMFLLRHGL